jgi:membrane-bound metal-dependent hydrolase YbcI (DUF457 family)
MPQAITHILIPLILVGLFRDYFVKNKKIFPLHYVLIAGIAGLIPDLDVAAYYLLSFFGYTLNEVHRTFSHNIFVPLIFLILGSLFLGVRNKELGKHKLKISTILFLTGFGSFMHILLDAIFAGYVMPFYPFDLFSIGLNIISYAPIAWQDSIIPSFEAVLLVAWLVYMELKHKISDFV